MTTIDRLAPDLARIDGQECQRTVARKLSRCAHSGFAIHCGDPIYRPLGNHASRWKRYLASEIDRISPPDSTGTRHAAGVS